MLVFSNFRAQRVRRAAAIVASAALLGCATGDDTVLPTEDDSSAETSGNPSATATTGVGGNAATTGVGGAGVGGAGTGGDASTTTTTTGSGAETCSDNVQNQDETGVDCGGVCPACPPPYAGSCNGDPGTGNDCGPTLDKPCCDPIAVPGGTFNRSNDASLPATVSDFKMDRYEVTAGRFRQFVEAGLGIKTNPPAVGSGSAPGDANSGWDATWDAKLKSTTASLSTVIKCESIYPVYTTAPGANEAYPMCCVTFYEAFAFCEAEGGRLPTEAEWNYVAAGGSEQRYYPWGQTQISANLALYDCRGDGSAPQQCAFSNLFPVGSRSPQGDGKWGHSDLAGSLFEWTLDAYVASQPMPCNDCVATSSAVKRTIRSGNFFASQMFQTTANRGPLDADFRLHCGDGFRCAYDN